MPRADADAGPTLADPSAITDRPNLTVLKLEDEEPMQAPQFFYFDGDGREIDKFGQPVRHVSPCERFDEEHFGEYRSKSAHPYDYSTHTVWAKPGYPEGNDSVWTDRILYEEVRKYQHLWEGKQYNGWAAHPSITEEFLRQYNNMPDLELVRICEGCNSATGYPLWLLIFKYDKPALTQKGENAKIRHDKNV